MTKKEIYDAEQSNVGTIVLYREGSFWIAYERSAYWFYHNVKQCKLTKKYIGTVGADVISLGFSDKGRLSPLVNLEILQSVDKKLVVKTTVAEADFDEFAQKFRDWKAGVGAKTPKARSTLNHESLPVYKAVYDLTLQVYKSSQHMQRDYRYTLGERIKNELVELLTLVYSANVSADKEPFVKEARRQIEVLRLQMRLLHDLGQVSMNNMVMMNLSIESISKQLTAWRNSMAGIKKPESAAAVL